MYLFIRNTSFAFDKVSFLWYIPDSKILLDYVDLEIIVEFEKKKCK
jgi:hypothetical protein